MQSIEKFINESEPKMEEFEAHVQRLNNSLSAHPFYRKLQVI